MKTLKSILVIISLVLLSGSPVIAAPPSNDNCGGATLVTLGGYVADFTDAATIDTVPACGSAITAPGRWYRLVGTGDKTRVETCSEFTDYDTRLTVFTGSCASLECVTDNDNEPSCFYSTTSQVEFCTVPGQNYYILIHGSGTASGGYDMSFSATGVKCCTPDGTVSCTTPVTGTTVGASDLIDSYACIGWNETGPEKTYLFEPTYDGQVTATLSDLSDDMDIFVLENSCDPDSCIAYGNTTTSFTAEAYKQYFIVVDGYNGAQGGFTVTLTCDETSSCSQCGPGPHWIDTCPAGLNSSLTQLMAIDIDLDYDCIADKTYFLNPCASGADTMALLHSAPMDDSVYFPGTKPIDGHLDVIDTEIVSMCLTDGNITFIAGNGLGHTFPLYPSLGSIYEDPSNNEVGHSFFYINFEIDLGFAYVYNQSPVSLNSEVTCLNPQASYPFPAGCIPLYTDNAAGYGSHVANITKARYTLNPGDETFCTRHLLGDVNNDCYVNMTDLAMMAIDWLSCVNEMDPACFGF